MLAYQEANNRMEKKNFNQEVEEIKKGVDDLAHKM